MNILYSKNTFKLYSIHALLTISLFSYLQSGCTHMAGSGGMLQAFDIFLIFLY